MDSVKSFKDLIPFIKEKNDDKWYVENVSIDYDLTFPFPAKEKLEKKDKSVINAIEIGVVFSTCNFTQNVIVSSKTGAVEFRSNCTFAHKVRLKNSSVLITFANATFLKSSELNAEDSTFNEKIRFRSCEFEGEVNFRNTTFNELADFWRCTFHKPTTFYKTDFFNITVFSAAVFEEDVLFTYALINKLVIFRGTRFDKGLDLSLAIISGALSVFDIRLKEYETYDYKKDVEYNGLDKKKKEMALEKAYEIAVSDLHKIPQKNKRETFRLLKAHHQKGNNQAAALEFMMLEKKSLRQELNLEKNRLWDQFILGLNQWSNEHGVNYVRAFLFTTFFGFVFFYLSFINSEFYEFSINPKYWAIEDGFEYYVQFMLPTHKFNYINGGGGNFAYFLFDFIGRMVVGYGIYQFIQAFRKYR